MRKKDSDKLIHQHEQQKCQRKAAQKKATDQKLMKESNEKHDSNEEQDWESYFRHLLYHDEIVHQG